MNFVFVTCRLVMGGNETLIKRMSDWLIKRGHRVSIVAAQGGFMADKFHSAANVYIVGSKAFGASLVPGFPYSRQLRNSFKDADVVMSFSSGGCMFAYHLTRSTGSKAKVLAGVFHPNTGMPNYGVKYFNNVFWEAVHDDNKIYMNRAILEMHEHALSCKLTQCQEWLLPVDIHVSSIERTTPDSIILSVGRLTQFKTYNLYMMDVIRNLIDRGYSDLKWVVVGDDEPDTREPVKSKMLARIAELGLEQHVRMEGIVPYEQLPDYFARAKIFIGMGTASIESAASGVPTICAVVDDADGKTYGFLWDQPKGCVGERLVSREPDLDVQQLIERVLDASQSEYEELQSKSLACVKEFDLDERMTEFLEIVDQSRLGFKGKPTGRTRHLCKKIMQQFSHS